MLFTIGFLGMISSVVVFGYFLYKLERKPRVQIAVPSSIKDLEFEERKILAIACDLKTHLVDGLEQAGARQIAEAARIELERLAKRYQEIQKEKRV